MRTFVFGFAAFLLFGWSVVYAHSPTATIDPVGTLTYATFPQIYTVTGAIAHSPIASVGNITLLVNGVLEASTTDPFIGLIGTTSPYALPWNITAPGTYTLTVLSRHGSTGQVATSTPEEATVVLEEVVIVDCIAAPAIAHDYLKNTLGMLPSGGAFKDIIRYVANETGKNGLLWAKDSCGVGYRSRVEDFVDALL